MGMMNEQMVSVPREPTQEMVDALKAELLVTSRGGILRAGVALTKAIAAAPVVQLPVPGGEPEVRAWEVEMYGSYDTLEDAEAQSQHTGYPVHELIRLSDYRAQITSLQAHIADLKSAGEYFHCHAIGDTPDDVCGAWEQHADVISRPSIGGE